MVTIVFARDMTVWVMDGSAAVFTYAREGRLLA
jgi:hypothetical protein